MMAYESLLIERRGAVGWLIFNRPAEGNAMDARMLDDLESAWSELNADPEVRVIVNTGFAAVFTVGLRVAGVTGGFQLRSREGRAE